mgnify:CR=1 FL=1
MGSADVAEISERDRQIDAMLAREAIRDLPVRYCHCVRTRDLETMLDLFADDGIVEMPKGVAASSANGGVFQGREALSQVFTAGYTRSDPWPFVHNHVVNLHGDDRASGFVYAEIRKSDEAMRVTLIVVYEDEYVKERGRWKFARRKMNGTPIPA